MQTVSVHGVEVPKVGLGTWRLTGQQCRETVETAVEIGYRHIDTAAAYGNEREVGAAIAESDVDREDLFVTTKVHARDAGYRDALDSIEASLDRLGLASVDLILLHMPNPLVPIEDTMAAFGEALDEGLVDNIGVSNFSRKRLALARDVAPEPILANQVLFNPYEPQRELLNYCQTEDVMLVGYSPLGHGGLLGNSRIRELASKYEQTPAQVAIRWATQHKHVATIPKATSLAHLEANLDVFDFSMTEAELDSLAIDSTLRSLASFVRGRVSG